jgi:hypothetical protein
MIDLSRKDNFDAMCSYREAQACAAWSRQATQGGRNSTATATSEELSMTTQVGLEKKERDFLAQCVGDAYQMLELVGGVDPNGPALVWLADQFMQLRRGDCPPAHAMTP